MRNRIAGLLALIGFTALAVVAGRVVHTAAAELGSRALSPGPITAGGDHAYTTGFYLVVLLALAGAGALSMTAHHFSHGRRAAARVRVRSADHGRSLAGLRPDDWRRD